MVDHRWDAACTIVEGACVGCGVVHAEPCDGCGRRGFHAAACAQNDERDDVAHVDAAAAAAPVLP